MGDRVAAGAPGEPTQQRMAAPVGRPARPAESVIAVGGSAGAIATLLRLVADLPEDLTAAVLIVIHRPPHAPSALPRLLASASGRTCRHARDGDVLEAGRVYVAPPDFHMRVKRGRVAIDGDPPENRNRPAIDPLFRSVAAACGTRAIAVLLSGTLHDGAAGMADVKRAGGIAVIQDPADAEYPEMPVAASRVAAIDHSVPAAELGALLGRLARELPRRAIPAEIQSDRIHTVRVGRADPPGLSAEGER